MKGMKVSFAIVAAASIIIGFGGMAYAFHSGGVAECEGCHSMHSPAGGALLTKSDASSTCLNCHENANGDTGPTSYHISTRDADLGAGMAPKQRTPGGDFGWLKKSYSMTIRGTASVEAGQTHGHNIIAADYNYTVDTDNPTAPGGTFNSAYLGCTACHDQHSAFRRIDNTGTLVKPGLGVAVPPIAGSGSYNTSANPVAGSSAVGVFRLLAGTGWTVDGITFAVNPPNAVVNGSYNRTEATSQVRDAYGSGMADWCATCHPDMHSDSGALVHPIDRTFNTTILANYNAYVKSGDLTGAQATSFSSLAPYEANTSDYAILKSLATYTLNQQPGPATGNAASVMCLSCHRAHAGGWMEGLRWMYQGEFMVYNGLYPGVDTTPAQPQFALGRQSAETQAAYYDRPVTAFATYQRMYCNKCHAKD